MSALSEELKWSIKEIQHCSLRDVKYAQGKDAIASVFGVLSGEMTPVNSTLYQLTGGLIGERCFLWSEAQLYDAGAHTAHTD